MDHNAGNGSGSDRYLVISADSHDSPPYHFEKYVEYFDPKYRGAYEEWLVVDGERVNMVNRLGGATIAKNLPPEWKSDHPDPYRRFFENMMIGRHRVDPEWQRECFDRYRPTEVPGYKDPIARVASQEGQGIVGEVIYSTGLVAGDAGQFGARDNELRRAGQEAHLRWLADYCGQVPGRLAAPIYVDGRFLDEAIADIRWARDHGIFGGVILPVARLVGGGMMSGGGAQVAEGPLPSYADPYWEPLWSVCEDLELPLVLHVGQNVAADVATASGEDPQAFHMLSSFDMPYYTVRPFFQLLAAGVLDRHPRLKYCASEIHVASLPAIFQMADHQTLGFHSFIRQGYPRRPSQYWYDQGFAAASLISRKEVANRHEIGINNLMFGSDYPHPEGAWPNTQTVIRYTFAGVPADDLRKILGENAARCFGFDLVTLREVADRVGPTVAEIAEPLPDDEIPPFASTYMLNREPQPA